VSAAVTVLTGRPAAELAAKRLSAPLGIRDYEWQADPNGVTAGGFGLMLRPLDLAKLAHLYLHQGRWGGHQVVPVADGYAYMAGLYGQLAAVIPAKDLVAVVTSPLPATVDATAVTRWLLKKYILPAAG
jgi:CubicO group peptidase (beta-lactamase class C family)